MEEGEEGAKEKGDRSKGRVEGGVTPPAAVLYREAVGCADTTWVKLMLSEQHVLTAEQVPSVFILIAAICEPLLDPGTGLSIIHRVFHLILIETP